MITLPTPQIVDQNDRVKGLRSLYHSFLQLMGALRDLDF